MKVQTTSPVDPRLALVRASPELVGKHDRQGWVALFSKDATIEDPQGTSVHTKKGGGIDAFYDTFISPNQVVFRVQHDFVCGDQVARDVIIDTTSKAGMQISTPAHLLYRVTTEDGELKLQSMQAQWEIRKMLVKALKMGGPGIKTLLGTSAHMLKNQGIKSTLLYARGMLCGVFNKGHTEAAQIRNAIVEGNAAKFASHFKDNGKRIEIGEGQPMDAEEFLKALGQPTTFAMGDVLSSGYGASFNYTMTCERNTYEGMAFLEFDPASKKILNARFLVNEVP